MPEQAARVSDMHTCPMLEHFVVGNGTVQTVAHVGGPILPPGSPNVFIAGQPAATVGDLCACTGPAQGNPYALTQPVDAITKGSLSVRINGKGAARRGDPTAHGGVIATGTSKVVIGG